MHNEEIGIVNVQLHRLKKILYSLLLRTVAIDQVFARASQHNLSGDADLGIFLKSNGRLLLVTVVEDDRYTGLCDSGLSTLVDEILIASQYNAIAGELRINIPANSVRGP